MNQTELAYVQGTVQVSVTATTEPTADVIVTLAAVVLGSADVVLLEFFCPAWGHSTTTNTSFLPIFDAVDGGAAAAVGRVWDGRAWVASQRLGSIAGSYRTTPGAGSHVFSARGHTAAGTFTLFADVAGAGLEVPLFLRVLQVA